VLAPAAPTTPARQQAVCVHNTRSHARNTHEITATARTHAHTHRFDTLLDTELVLDVMNDGRLLLRDAGGVLLCVYSALRQHIRR
jgi:hypothetical protein